MQLYVTDHAYERYCERVEPIDRHTLEQQLQTKVNHPDRKKGQYIKLSGIWWRHSIEDRVMTLYTCYGRHHYDLPAAIKWAKRYNDRIALGEDDGE